MDIDKAKALLKNALVLHEEIMELSEDELSQLIDIEQNGKRREGIFDRLYGRFSKVRTARERAYMRLGKFKVLRGACN